MPHTTSVFKQIRVHTYFLHLFTNWIVPFSVESEINSFIVIAIVRLNSDVVDASHRRSNLFFLEVLLKGASL
jgi:hypothetical protein